MSARIPLLSSMRRWQFMALLAVAIIVVLTLPKVIRAFKDKEAADQPSETDSSARVELVKGSSDTLDVPPEVVKALGLRTAEVRPDSTPRTLKLDGTLFVDPSHLSRVHTRFPGEVVEIGPTSPMGRDETPARLRFGDRVEQGQLLAVVWSKDLGEKKSELVDAILHRRLDEETLKRLRDLADKGATPEQKLRDARHNFEADLIAETRAERTLHAWRLSDDEIKGIRKEADELHEGNKARDPRADNNWSRVEVLAPVSGVLIEMNVGQGDIVDTTLDLFKIADLRKLRVQCQIFEEDLPLIQALPESERTWTVQLGNDHSGATVHGGFDRFDQIGHIIDPNTHTAQVLGWVDNLHDRLLVGQFVTATVSLPPPANQVAVPTAAVIEDGSGATVFVRRSTDGTFRVQRRRVAVVRQGEDTVGLLEKPSAEQQKQGVQSLEPHDLVVATGALQLAAELEDQAPR